MNYDDLILLQKDVHPSFQQILSVSTLKPAWQSIAARIQHDTSKHLTLWPEPENILSALTYRSVQDTQVIIVGQDPYHQPHQAHGLAFSVKNTQPAPPSLRHILKELTADLNLPPHSSHCLIPWAKQGVLLINRILTVVEKKPLSHSNIGWEDITAHLLKTLAKELTHLVFILWGLQAQTILGIIQPYIHKQGHHIIQSPHPSPLSAYRGFFGSKPFSQANEFLTKHHKDPIDWPLP
ncbi:MAG: uracil-DNA glycosylase [Proteobacteria bacterium]|nr:uracil-DNA glycosylase [Pseudomonadota bacterium]